MEMLALRHLPICITAPICGHCHSALHRVIHSLVIFGLHPPICFTAPILVLSIGRCAVAAISHRIALYCIELHHIALHHICSFQCLVGEGGLDRLLMVGV